MKVLREIISVILIVTLTTVTMGITLHYHFCGKSEILSVNVFDNVECHCKPVEVASCCEHHNKSQTCLPNTGDKSFAKTTLTHDKCCLEYSAIVHLDETFLSSTFSSITLKYPTTYVKSVIMDTDTYQQIKTLEERAKTYYSGFKRNIIRFIHLISSFDKKDLPDDSL